MQPDEELCLCFHVTRRKVANYLRIEKPRRVAQLADCFGAGTGCGWCRPYLEKMFTAAQAEISEKGPLATRQLATGKLGGNDAEPVKVDGVALPTAADYARRRSQYVREGGGTPPPGSSPLASPDSP